MSFVPIRKNVRDVFRSLLLNNTNAADRVFTDRDTPLLEHEVSAIHVYTRDGTPEYSKKYEDQFIRKLQVFAEVLVRKTETVVPEDEAEIITGQIEDIILPNHYLQDPPPQSLQTPPLVTPGSIVVDEVQLGMTTEGKTPEGITNIASLITEFIVEYTYYVRTGSAVPFNTADVQYNLEGQQAEADRAHDRFSIPQ